eukprot:scaffold148624_cov35-Tisochrysis_lutea.AAC.2
MATLTGERKMDTSILDGDSVARCRIAETTSRATPFPSVLLCGASARRSSGGRELEARSQ